MDQTTARPTVVAIRAGTTTARAATSMGGGVLAVSACAAWIMAQFAARNDQRLLPG